MSSELVAAGLVLILRLKNLQSAKFSIGFTLETSRKHPASKVVRSLFSRYCSGPRLVAQYSIGLVPARSANENPVSRSNLFPDGIQKLRLCSRLGLASVHNCGTGYTESTNISTVYLPKLRHCCRERLAMRWTHQRTFSESSNRDTPCMSNPCQTAKLPKGRQCSAGALVNTCRYGTDSRQSTNEDSLSMSNPRLRAYLEHLTWEQQRLRAEITDEKNAANGKKQRRLRRRLAELTPLVEKMEEWTNKQTELGEIEELTSGASNSAQDKEMKELALLEKDECLEIADSLEKDILGLLTLVDDTDDNDIVMEFSAGVGGQEAMLFTADMFEMYERFAAYRNWDFQKLEYFTTDLGGLRHASVSVCGDGAYKLMRHEAGVHRVQRVPKTEKAGRIHTSTMAVAVLPQPKEIDLKLDPKDLRVETKKASGAGGQHVQTTDSAVRILHIPTGLAAESQQERSQLKNRHIAMVMLQAKIYNAIVEQREATERSVRRSQVGSSGRSEKIRTYNFQQDRVTDHRVGQSVYDVAGFLSGGERLDEMISCLVKEEEKEQVARMLEEFEETQRKT